MITFFHNNKQLLYKKCTDFRQFSHCPPFYLFQFDLDRLSCHSYTHERCIKNILIISRYRNFTGVTLTTVLTPNRMDSLPLHLKRWKGPMSIAIQLEEDELEQMASTLLSLSRRDIRFTLYIVKKRSLSFKCTFQTMKNKTERLQSCFVINELRNLPIETIRTTHYLLVDGDGLVSSMFL